MDRGTVGSASRGRLNVAIRHQGASAIVTVAGELDHHTADLLRESLEGCVADGFARLVVDCSQLEFMDSTGLNVLLGARLKAEAGGGGVHLAGMQPVVARVFEITARTRCSPCTTPSTRLSPTDGGDGGGAVAGVPLVRVARVTTSVPKKWVFSRSRRAGDI